MRESRESNDVPDVESELRGALTNQKRMISRQIVFWHTNIFTTLTLSTLNRPESGKIGTKEDNRIVDKDIDFSEIPETTSKGLWKVKHQHLPQAFVINSDSKSSLPNCKTT